MAINIDKIKADIAKLEAIPQNIRGPKIEQRLKELNEVLAKLENAKKDIAFKAPTGERIEFGSNTQTRGGQRMWK